MTGTPRMIVSLIIPAYNEAMTIQRLLDSVTAQRRKPTEVIVVDAGSTDGTAAIVEGYSAPFPLHLVRRPRLHPGQARNEGALVAKGDWLAFTDSGVVLDRDWLAELASAALRTGASAVMGTYDPEINGPLAECQTIAYVPCRTNEGWRGPTTVSLLLSRSAFVTTGGFPEYRAAEDLLFFDKLVAAQVSSCSVPSARVTWSLPDSVAAIFRRFHSYSFHNLVARRAHDWHLGVLRQYLAVALLALLFARQGGAWVVPLLLPLLLLARASKRAWLKRGSEVFPTLTIRRVTGAAAVLAVVDLAMITGAVGFLLAGRPRSMEPSN